MAQQILSSKTQSNKHFKGMACVSCLSPNRKSWQYSLDSHLAEATVVVTGLLPTLEGRKGNSRALTLLMPRFPFTTRERFPELWPQRLQPRAVSLRADRQGGRVWRPHGCLRLSSQVSALQDTKARASSFLNKVNSTYFFMFLRIQFATISL